jgi:hypothetical protein
MPMGERRLSDPLTIEQLRAALDYDPNTGIFIWKHRPECPPFWNGRWVDRAAGVTDKGYRVVTVNRIRYQASRLAWLFVYGEWPENLIDHANGDTSDNRIANLRDATFSQNGGNMRMPQRNKSGFKGVSWDKRRKKWAAQIGVRGNYYNLGSFNTAEEAHDAYCRAAARLHGEFARFG